MGDWGFTDGWDSSLWGGDSASSVTDGWFNDAFGDTDWSTIAGGSTDTGFNWGSLIGSIFGGGSGGSSSGGSNIWGQMLAGALGGYGQGAMTEATARIQGENNIKGIQETAKQARQTANFAAELQDYYTQRDKATKRQALDTYGQFSLTDRYAPGMQKVAPVVVPNKPALQ